MRMHWSAKNGTRTLFGIAWLAAAAAAAAGLAPDRFPLTKDLQPPAQRQNEMSGVVVDADLFASLDDAMANLRLFDDEGLETPFLLRLRAPTRAVIRLVPLAAPSPVESARELPGNRLELLVRRAPGTPVPVALRVESALRDFEKLVSVWGSADGTNWTALATDAPIYDYARFVDLRKDTVNLGPADYPLFRIEVSNLTAKRDSPLVEIIRQTRGSSVSNEVEATAFLREPFRIERLILLREQEDFKQEPFEKTPAAITGWAAREDAREHRTFVTFGTRREPLVKVTLETDQANFSRSAELEGAASTNPPAWEPVASTTLSRVRIGKVQQDALTFTLPREVRHRAYRVTIHNGDNPPIPITGVAAEAGVYELMFFPKAGRRYRLGYGGADVPAPHYDIAAVLARAPAGAADVWTAGPEKANPGFRPERPARGNGKLALILCVSAMAVVLAVLIARLAQRIAP